MRNRIVGSSINNLNSTILNEFNIPLPPLEIQDEIVRELEQYQKIIDGSKQVVDNYKPVIDIDPSWEMKRLDEIGKVCMCKRIFKEQTSSKGDVPFYKIGTFGGKPDSYIDIELFNEFKSKYSYPKKGDILISTSYSAIVLLGYTKFVSLTCFIYFLLILLNINYSFSLF